MIPTIAIVAISRRTQCVVIAFGNIGSEKRTKPYVPIFSRTPARMTEPAVGASTCASGSHVGKGNIGTLTANPKNRAKKTRIWRGAGIEGVTAVRAGMSNVGAWWRPAYPSTPEVL